MPTCCHTVSGVVDDEFVVPVTAFTRPGIGQHTFVGYWGGMGGCIDGVDRCDAADRLFDGVVVCAVVVGVYLWINAGIPVVLGHFREMAVVVAIDIKCSPFVPGRIPYVGVGVVFGVCQCVLSASGSRVGG